MDVTDLSRALRRYWLLATATFAITLLVGYGLAASGGPTFEAEATISVSPNPTDGGSVLVTDFEIPTIVEVISSRDFESSIRSTINEAVADDVITLSAQREGDSGIVTITATGADRRAVTEWANAAATEIVERYAPSDDDPETPPLLQDLVDVRLVDAATRPSGDGRENVAAIMLASVVLGIILAGAVAALAYSSRVTFDLAAQIRSELDVPVLGEVPFSTALRGVDADLPAVMETGDPSVIEAFQSLRSSIEAEFADGAEAIAITSWRRDEGKTTLTAALGVTLADAGHHVVVIDTDLRTPALHERLDEPFGEGLAESADLGHEMIVQETRHPNLSLVPAGVPERHPAQIVAVALPHTIEAIRAARPETYILIDGPALGPVLDGGRGSLRIVAEAPTIAKTAHRLILVIDGSDSRLPELAHSVRRLRDDGVVVVGAVINRRRRRTWWPW